MYNPDDVDHRVAYIRLDKARALRSSDKSMSAGRRKTGSLVAALEAQVEMEARAVPVAVAREWDSYAVPAYFLALGVLTHSNDRRPMQLSTDFVRRGLGIYSQLNGPRDPSTPLLARTHQAARTCL